MLVDMVQTEEYGYYHATNEGGYISWYDFTVEIFRQAVEMGRTEYSEERLTVAPVTTEETVTPVETTETTEGNVEA